MDGFNAAYANPPRPFLRQELLGIALVFLCAVPLMLASSLVLFGDAVGSWLWHMTHAIDPALKPLAALVYFSRGLHGTIALAATALLTALLYRYAPNRNQPWMQVWPGAILSTVLWLVMTLLFRWYVRNISNYNVLYGSVGTSMALLIWMYLLSAALLVGCEFNAALERGVAAAKEFRTAVPPRREVPVP
jgi:membrane protein